MTTAARFYSRTRMAEARMLMRNTTDFTTGNTAVEVITALLEDVAADLANHAEGQEEAAFALIMRCAGNVARENARDAYDRCGFPNPFMGGGQPVIAAALTQPLWQWPVIVQTPDGTTGNFEGAFRAFSALKMFGYTVGKTKGWAKPEREAFLSDFMEQDLPAIIVQTFAQEYSDPMSAERLRKIANVIASNASNAYRKGPALLAEAISDWESDLAFLKRKYYIGARLAFEWPSVRNDTCTTKAGARSLT
jgi:hypothetical protein